MLASCNTISSFQQLMTSVSTPTDPNLLYFDDFSRASSGWDRVSTDNGMTDYKDGAFIIRVPLANNDLLANPGKDFTDVRIEADAQKTGGPENNTFGLICRYQDPANFYFGVAASDGYYGIGKVADGGYTLLTGDQLQPTNTVKSGGAVNHLRLDCVGSSLTLYVNDNTLATIEDSDFLQGDVGVTAGTLDTGGTEISFDNFTVLKPQS